MSRMKNIALLGFLSILPFQAGAAVIENHLGAPGITNGWVSTGQIFTAPGGIGALTKWEFEIEGRTDSSTLDFSVHEWNGTVGAQLYSQVVSWPVVAGVVAIDGLNVTVTPGNTYVSLFHVFGLPSIHYQGDVYGGGFGVWSEDGVAYDNFDGVAEHGFRATFDGAAAVPEPSTLFTFGLASLGLLFGRRIVGRR
jgi:hypothetical protein